MTKPSATDALEAQLTDALEAMKSAREAEAAAATLPDDVTFYLSEESPTALTLGPVHLAQGDTVTIRESDWRAMLPAQRDNILDIVNNHQRQRDLLGGVFLHVGVGPRVEAEVGSDAWRLQRRRDWQAAHALPEGDAKVTELARLQAFYTAPEQTERASGQVVKSTITGSIGGGHRSDLVGPPR
ncbi:MAG: hypothetical protein WKF57_10555 [Nakamurella sp.]